MPNIVAFPFPDFDFGLLVKKMGESGKKVETKAFVNISKVKVENDQFIRIKTDEVEILAKVIKNEESKKKVIDEMNFKYRYPLDIDYPLVQFLEIRVNLEKKEEEELYLGGDENSSITELLN